MRELEVPVAAKSIQQESGWRILVFSSVDTRQYAL
jgi:hypothetical protein